MGGDEAKRATLFGRSTHTGFHVILSAPARRPGRFALRPAWLRETLGIAMQAVTCVGCKGPFAPEALWAFGNADNVWHTRLLCRPCVDREWPYAGYPVSQRRSRVCCQCGRRRYQNVHRLHVYCTEDCERQARRERRRRPRGRKPGVCTYCEQPFTASRSDARYCSPSCRQFAYRQRIDGHQRARHQGQP